MCFFFCFFLQPDETKVLSFDLSTIHVLSDSKTELNLLISYQVICTFWAEMSSKTEKNMHYGRVEAEVIGSWRLEKNSPVALSLNCLTTLCFVYKCKLDV